MSNRLENALSPYLLQHAQNPVDWYPWGEEAFEKAKKDNKPVLVSIGYSACHWCHVMEEESFEDERVSAYMNAHFINVKVDREEHPDVDHLYMDALQAMTGSGGWPLNMFVTPDKKPFYGGTYFPPKQMYNRSSWLETLQAVNKAWHEQGSDIQKQAEQLITHLEQSTLINKVEPESPHADLLNHITGRLLQQADKIEGGFGDAPKFPSVMAIQYLLEYYHFQKEEGREDEPEVQEALSHALLSLDKMIDGGIYDQIGGGFSRYTVDHRWQVPHFEKMLYDNALLIALLSDAYVISGKAKYKTVIDETIAFCTSALTNEDGIQEGFYCALDADSEGEEGKFYTWTQDQFLQAVPHAHPALIAYFGITEEGNWEGTNILRRALHRKEILVHYSLPLNEWYAILQEGKEALLNKRSERVPPAVDDKILLSWNALMNIALCRAALALKSEAYLIQAGRHLSWLMANFKNEKGLWRVYKDKVAYVPAKLDDYAYLIEALLNYASITGETGHVLDAYHLMQTVLEKFGNEEKDFFYFSNVDQTDIVVRKIDLYDGAIPSANATLAASLIILGNVMEKPEWLYRGEGMIRSMQSVVQDYPLSFSGWATYLQRSVKGWKQLLIVGDDAKEKLKRWQEYYFPEVFVLASSGTDACLPVFKHKNVINSTLLYLCESRHCKKPVLSIDEIIKELKKTG